MRAQPTYGVDAGIRAWAPLVGGERSHHCSTLAPFFLHDLTAHHLSNRKRFPCLHSLIQTREGLGEFETVVQTRDEVEGLHCCRDFPNPSSVYIRICKHRKKVFYCFYKKNFQEKKSKTLLFRALIKREILTSREVLYTKLVRVISPPCFAEKMLCKIQVFLN